MYNEGISKVGDLLDLAVDREIVTKRGSYYYYNEENLAQGRENTKEFLRENPEILEEINAIIHEELLPNSPMPLDH
jgi:recombination protein RecA